MLMHIPDVLTPDIVGQCRAALADTAWQDGSHTAGFQSALCKRNRQLATDSPLARQWGTLIEKTLRNDPLFVSAALPAMVFPPLFNRYDAGDGFGMHIDNAIRYPPGAVRGVRTDLSATLFLSEPDEYDGGELVIEDTFGEHQVKLPAGDMVLYPASSLHRVNPIHRGSRVAAFFWVQSLVRDDGARALLYQLDNAIQEIHQSLGAGHAATIGLSGVYHNLLRRWAEP